MSDRLLLRQRPWLLVPVLIAVCWASAFLGPLSVTILLAVPFGVVATVKRRAWLPLTILLLANPLSVAFIEGVVSYARGAPGFLSVGLPVIESFNVDRSTRCFRSGGGCLVSGNEWVFMFPHNSAVRLMSRVFGPAWRTYDGPYPTKDEALALVRDAPPTPVQQFLQGQVVVDGEVIDLGKETVGKLAKGLRWISLDDPELQDQNLATIQCAPYQTRCLVLRLRERYGETEEYHADVLILFDRWNVRPFAYFTVSGRSTPWLPPVWYLPERDL